MLLLLFAGFFMIAILARYFFGMEAVAPFGIAGLAGLLGDHLVAVAGLSLITVLIYFAVAGRQLKERIYRSRPAFFISALLFLLVSALAIDAGYRVTPISALLPDPPSEHHHARVERMTVEEILYFTDVKPRVETEGVLDFEERMRRFVLKDPDSTGRGITVRFYHGRSLFGSSFDEMREIGDGRQTRSVLYSQVEPHLGRRVRITGSVSNGHIRAQITEVEPAEEQSGSAAR